jgi:uncharacterized protein (TIGR03067 family)
VQGDQHAWYFRGKEFILAADKGELPAGLVRALLGPGGKAARIRGEWDLDADKQQLVLTGVVADGRSGPKEARLGISPAGAVRVNIENAGQYNLMSFAERLHVPGPGETFPIYDFANRIDLEFLQGAWDLRGSEVDGKVMEASALKGSRVLVTGTAITLVAPGATSRGTFQLDSVPTPRTLDVTFTDGPEKGTKYLGIYDLRQDTWKFCRALAEKDRPTTFAAKAGSGHVLQTLERTAEPPAPKKVDELPEPMEFVPPAPGLDPPPPVTRERLIGTSLQSDRTPPDEIVWEFTEDRFVLRVKGAPAPSDLFAPLLGKGMYAARIEGSWQLSADNKFLELSGITGDGKEGAKRARLPVGPTSLVRLRIGERHYNVLPKPVKAPPKALTNSLGMKLALVPKGKVTMGSPSDEPSRKEDERQHEVEITRPFYLGAYEVTQAQYQKVMGTNPSFFSKDGRGSEKVKGTDTADFPVEGVSWSDAVAFCRKLSAQPAEQAAGRVYRLPAEAEWEYACRAGTTTLYHYGDGLVGYILSSIAANVSDNRRLGRTCKVGSYKPNAFGLYDMHGNVAEWCADWYEKDFYKNSPKKNPRGPDNGLGHLERVVRGGSWESGGRQCRSACRDSAPGGSDGARSTIGFRVVCSMVGPKGEVKVAQSWDGIIDGNQLKELTADGKPGDKAVVISGQNAWAKVWKAWRGNEKVPDVDFTEYMVLVFTHEGPNRISPPTLVRDDRGDLEAWSVATLLPGNNFCYKIVVVRSQGILTVNGAPLPDE